MIFTSNHSIPDIEETVGLKERFLIINVPPSFKSFIPRAMVSGFYRQNNDDPGRINKSVKIRKNVNPKEKEIEIQEQTIPKTSDKSNDELTCTIEVPSSRKLDGSMKKLSINL